jgi:hypothetical protein
MNSITSRKAEEPKGINNFIFLIYSYIFNAVEL